MQEENWYFLDTADQNKPKGPISRRDLDVMIKTNVLDSDSYVFQQGFSGWTQIRDIMIHPEDMHEVMLRTEEYFAPKKSKQERLKELAQEVIKKNAEAEAMKPGNKIEPEDDNDNQQSSEDASEKGGDNIPGLDLDKVVEQLARETGVDMAEIDEKRARSRRVSIAGQEMDHLHPDSQDIKKQGDQSAPANLSAEELRKQRRKEKKKQRAKEKRKKNWYDPRINSCIYVQGLPLDITRNEVVDFFSKAGVIRLDTDTGQEKIKLYTLDDKSTLKGDGSIFYAKPESLEIALDNLNGAEIRPGFKITIEPAKFEQKGEVYKQRQKKEIDEIAKIKFKVNQEKQFGWKDVDDGDGLRIVIIKNMFTPEDIINGDNFALGLEQAIKDECEEKLGKVKKIIVHEFNPDGVVQIKFEEPKAAEECLALMDGRFFNGRELKCFYWDGKTNYRVVKDTVSDQQKRLDAFGFGKWLETNLDEVEIDIDEEQEGEEEVLGDGDKTPENID